MHNACLCILILQHLSPTQSTEEERLATNTVGGNASWLSALSIPG